MRHKVIIVILLTVLTGFSGRARAQSAQKNGSSQEEQSDDKTYYSWKDARKEEREERKRLREERKMKRLNRRYGNDRVESNKKPPTPPPAFTYPPTTLKPRYRIDVLASLYLDELVQKKSATFKDKIPDKALAGVSFYEGVSIAADSLKKAGFNIDIYIHDVASASESAEMLISKGIIDSTDLIIGAVPPGDIPVLAAHAKKMKINFVSVLSPSDAGVKGNKYFTLLQPAFKTHCGWIEKDIAKKYPGDRVALFYRTSVEADEHAWMELAERNGSGIRYRQYLCNTLPKKQDLLTIIDSTRPNVVVIPVHDPVYADSLLKVLSRAFPFTHFEVYGMSSWSSIARLRKDDAYPNLGVNITASYHVDPANPAAKYVARTYKELFGGRATETVYRGYEILSWYAHLMKKYGTFFNSDYTDNTGAPFTKFEIKQRRDDDGRVLYSENTRIYLSKYEGGQNRVE